MHNIIILGAARSGTSMIAGLFNNPRVFQGDGLLPANAGNPWGYFEDQAVNNLNDRLLDVPFRLGRIRYLAWTLTKSLHLDVRAYFLAAPGRPWQRRPGRNLRLEMQALTAKQPFCFKDPRFNVTLPAWRAFLPASTRFITVFREPQRTIQSMLRLAGEEPYRPPLNLSARRARTIWARTYRRLLDEYSREGEWLFVHYDDALSGRAIPAIRDFSAAELDTSMLDPTVSRSARRVDWGIDDEEMRPLYEQLCERARQDLVKWGTT